MASAEFASSSYLSVDTFQRLREGFAKTEMSLEVRDDHIVAKGSSKCTEDRVDEVVREIGFMPLFSNYKIDSNYVFTIMPYKVPKFFIESTAVTEMREVFKRFTFAPRKEAEAKDRWDDVNRFRAMVSPALDKGLSEIVGTYAKDDQPVIEIGSGIGYTLERSVAARTIRTQYHLNDCQLLSESFSGPIYQMDIAEVCRTLEKSGKKAPLFFALNVFDALSQKDRKASFTQIGRVQNAGDQILIMLDTNPYLESVLERLKTLYPESVPFPYYPKGYDPNKFSLIMVPMKNVGIKRQPTAADLCKRMTQESETIARGGISHEQMQFRRLQQQHNLPVIVLEDFFVELLNYELAEAGYEAESCYHAAFTSGVLPKGLRAQVKQDLMYKSVTDSVSVRQWDPKAEKFVEALSTKQLSLPTHINEEYLSAMRKKGHHLFGAEILLIVATKA